jgi:hypothetical protein
MRLPILSALSLSIAAFSGPATAQSQDPPLAIHGFNDVSVKNDYITPRGLLVTNNRITTQILNGLVLNLYNDPAAPISSVSLVAGIWNDLDGGQRSRTVGSWNEFDWFVGANFQVGKFWELGVTYVEFLSPPGNFAAEHNLEFSAKFDDSSWLAPISLHPYAKLFYEVSGPSTVVTGRNGSTFDVELGVVPTIDLHPWSVPATLTAPTWFTVGPASYWGGNQNFGVVTTGLTGTFPIDTIPKQYGAWNFHLGVQYYHLINDRLLLAQRLIGSAGGPGSRGLRDVVVGFAGIGINF